MIHNFKAISLSYKNSPIFVRELVALNENQCKNLLTLLKNYIPASDMMVLSTCNRTEVYYKADEDYSNEIIQLLAFEKGISDTSHLISHFQVINSDADAVQHLFNVSLGLESQVVGDLQISNQVKRAYQYAAEAGLAGAFLHRLMHTIFAASKRVAQETCFRDGAASVSYATVELVREVTSAISKPSILVIGLGEIGADVSKNLCKAEVGKIKVANRTLEKSVALAQAYPLEVVMWENIPEQIALADAVICAVPGLQPFLTKASLQNLSILNHKCFIDLSMPRSMEDAIEDIPGVLLYNIDNIKNKATQALEKRKASIPQVQKIIEEAIIELSDWAKEIAFSPIINDLKNSLEKMRQQEINRHARHLTNEENKKVDAITKNLIQKVLKMPVLQLKAACKRGEAEQMAQILRTLFDLEQKKST